jgi:hypothetical protein
MINITVLKCLGCWEIVEGTAEATNHSDAAEIRKLDNITKCTIGLACGDATNPHIFASFEIANVIS